MKRTLRLCNWQRRLMKIFGYTVFSYIALAVTLIIVDALVPQDMTLLVVRVSLIGCMAAFIPCGVYFIVKKRARNAVFDELRLLFKTYFEMNKIPLEVQCVSANEYEYNNAYCVTLTGGLEMQRCPDLIEQLLAFKSCTSYALNKHVHIYCNEIRVC